MSAELADTIVPAEVVAAPVPPAGAAAHSCTGCPHCAAELAALRADLTTLLQLATQLAASAVEAQKMLTGGGGIGALLGLFGRK